jgi:hypothetical protein
MAIYTKTPIPATELFSEPSQKLQKGGWILIWRTLLEHPYVGLGTGRLEQWIDMIAMASFEGPTIGGFVVSERFLASRWKWSRKAVRCFLEGLENQLMIQRSAPPTLGAQVGSHPGTHITICNYKEYQERGPTKGPREGPKDKEGKKLRKIPLPKGKGGQQADPVSFFEAYCASVAKSGLPHPRGGLTTSRLSAIKAREREHGAQGLEDLITAITVSAYIHKGGHDGTWRPTLDWFLKPTNFAKTIEGSYGNGAVVEDRNSLDYYHRLLNEDRGH